MYFFMIFHLLLKRIAYNAKSMVTDLIALLDCIQIGKVSVIGHDRDAKPAG
jgi:pimeloyl-ACP methyl ester carboxylesterase